MAHEKILLVGGAGYIGGHLADVLAQDNYQVTIYDNLLYETRFLKPLTFVKGDVRDKELLGPLLDEHDVVIWLAAIVGDGACAIDPDLTKEVNESSTKWLVDNYKGKIIFTSTCSVYGANDSLIDESATPNPLSVYAETKLAAERYIVENCSNHLVFRLGTLYGQSDYFSRVRLDLVVNILTAKAVQGEKLSVFGGEQWRPLLHVKDVTTAVTYGIRNNVKGLYNLAEQNYRISDIANNIKKIIPYAEIEFGDKPFEDLRNYRVSTSKIENVGWTPLYDLDTGIKEIANLIAEDRIVNIKDPIYSNENFLANQ